MASGRIGKGGRGRPGRTAEGGGAGLLAAPVYPDDFTYLGSFKIPNPSPAGGFEGWNPSVLNGPSGLAFRNEPSDGSTPKHLITNCYASDTGHMGHHFEFGIITPEIPGSPLLTSSYSTAPLRKNYGSIYGVPTVNYKRTFVYQGSPAEFSNRGLTPAGSIGWDPVNEKLWWTYNFSYGQVGGDTCIGYSELNYSAGTATPHGPFVLSAIEQKGMNSGVCVIPAASVTALGLGDKTLGLVGTMQVSTIADGDASIGGPAFTAFSPTSLPSEGGTITDNTKLAYYPYTYSGPSAGFTRLTKLIPHEGVPHEPLQDWADTYWNDQDHTWGGVYVRGTTKAEFVSFSRMNADYPWYVSGGQGNESTYYQINIIAEQDMKDVFDSVIDPNEVAVDQNMFEELPFDYSKLNSVLVGNIATITSPVGENEATPNNPNPEQVGPGALITMTAAHGLDAGAFPYSSILFVHDSGVDEYDNAWQWNDESTTQLRIGDNNHDNLSGKTWEGTTATTGTVRTSSTGDCAIFGTAYDPDDQRIYVGWLHSVGSTYQGMISVFELDI